MAFILGAVMLTNSNAVYSPMATFLDVRAMKEDLREVKSDLQAIKKMVEQQNKNKWFGWWF